MNPEPSHLSASQSLYNEALDTINGDRRQSYGEVHTSFARVSRVWSSILGHEVTPHQVCLCMIGLKVCREANSHKRDNLVDLAGYTGLLEELHQPDPQTEEEIPMVSYPVPPLSADKEPPF